MTASMKERNAVRLLKNFFFGHHFNVLFFCHTLRLLKPAIATSSPAENNSYFYLSVLTLKYLRLSGSQFFPTTYYLMRDIILKELELNLGPL